VQIPVILWHELSATVVMGYLEKTIIQYCSQLRNLFWGMPANLIFISWYFENMNELF